MSPDQLKNALNESKWIIMLMGFAGGAGPSLSELAGLSQTGSFEWPKATFWIAPVVYGFLGIILVIAGREKTSWKAILQGLGAPAFFSSASNIAVATACVFGSMNVAYAGVHEVNINSYPSKVDSVNLTIMVQSDDTLEVICGNRIYRVSDTARIKIPYIRMVSIRNGSIVNNYQIPEKDSVTIKTKVNRKKALRHLIQGLLPMQKNVTDKIAKQEIEIEEQQLQE